MLHSCCSECSVSEFLGDDINKIWVSTSIRTILLHSLEFSSLIPTECDMVLDCTINPVCTNEGGDAGSPPHRKI